jgi:putative ABC transport system permease protein
MRMTDILGFCLGALGGNRVRTALMLLAMAIGVGAVVVLTGVGEGARRFVVGEFASLGTNLVIVLPGRSETAGLGPASFVSETPRDLTIRDAIAIGRDPAVRRVAPINVGEMPVSWGRFERQVPVIGTTSEFIQIRHWMMERGRFLPPGDPEGAAPVCVIGAKVRQELFGNHRALGEFVTLGGRRFRVIGILGSKGRSIGVDVEELVVIPVGSAQMLLDTNTLFRILIEAKDRDAIPKVVQLIEKTIQKRHQGELDITVVTQDAVLATFDKILQALTVTVGGIAAISLGVAGILVMNVMLIAVSQRTAEIGLLKALGAQRGEILTLILTEAGMLSLIGAALGYVIGEAGNRVIHVLYPALPVDTPWWAVGAAVGVAVLSGLVFGMLPARRASRLDPVQALYRK